MPLKPSKSVDEQIFEAKLKLVELDEQYKTQLYFETMPEYDPLYKYCFDSSNRSIPAENQSIDAWLRAVIKHMGLRLPGHGGAKTNAVLVSVNKEIGKYEDLWIEYETRKLRKLVAKKSRPKAIIK